MRGGGGWSPCLRALGGQRGFRKERRRMASGNGLPSSPALVAKSPSALGPFPRYIWIHQDTPQDSLDKTCHEIWKRVQGLPEALQPRTKEQLSAPMAGTPRDNGLSFQEEALELSRDKDEISLLVEQEFLSLTKEHLILVTESSGELEAPGISPEGPRQPAPCLLAPPPVANSSEYPGTTIIAADTLLEPKVAVSMISSRQDCDSVMSTVTGILRAAKVKSVKGTEDGGHILGASNSEINRLLAQFPLKSTEATRIPDNKMVLEETRVIKDFLQNSMFSGLGPREATGLGPFLLLPPPPPAPPDKLPELPAQKRQLPVFAKICSKPEADSAMERHLLMRPVPTAHSQDALPAGPAPPAGLLLPTGDAVQSTADGTADFPLFLHSPAELHPLRPAQLSVPSEDTSKAVHQPPRPFPHGRRWVTVPGLPGIRVSPQPTQEVHPVSRKLLGRGGGMLGEPRWHVLGTYAPWLKGGRGPVPVGGLCGSWMDLVWR
uniref:uncharacterized protein C1orf94 homolog isoform X4 n=1 Tax=Halichoerus grypus TaxID=9711 RepID=UPI0016592C4E|nr:uncharacterized protein C1orf94 homolog isoform X4 [Halichoerus grypus]